MEPDVLQSDLRRKFAHELGSSEWVQVYLAVRQPKVQLSLASALVPNGLTAKALQHPQWDLRPDLCLPGCIQFGPGAGRVEYYRFGRNDGIEPFVLERCFHDIKPSFLELLEEFRLFHNLWCDPKAQKYFKITNAGEEYEVARIEPNGVSVRMPELKHYLGIKEMHLALYVDSIVWSDHRLAELGLTPACTDVVEDNLRYAFDVADDDLGGEGSFSRLLGKKLIPGLPKERSGIWPYDRPNDEKKQYTPFIVGLREDGSEELAPCDPHGGRYLQPVFFKREVLAKYYANPSRYSVEDGYLRCGLLWGMRIDNNHPDYIIAFLGDIGGDLPESEHPYWRSFNVVASKGMSTTQLRRSFLAEFAEPSQPDLVFKARFHAFKEKWKAAFGWELFKPLSQGDRHCLDALRVPLTTEQLEFDNQVLALSKILVDSLNEFELAHQVGAMARDLKGIQKLGRFIAARNAAAPKGPIDFLSGLQALRSSGAAHRKGPNYERAITRLGLQEKDTSAAFTTLLQKATEFLSYLESNVLPAV